MAPFILNLLANSDVALSAGFLSLNVTAVIRLLY